MTMSSANPEKMTNHHAATSFAAITETLQAWRDRAHQRRELAHWSERDMHDIGLSRTDVMAEAEKPFWRA